MSKAFYEGPAADSEDPLFREYLYFDTCISNRLFAPIRALDKPVTDIADVDQKVRDKLHEYHALRGPLAELIQSLNDVQFCKPESQVPPLQVPLDPVYNAINTNPA